MNRNSSRWIRFAIVFGMLALSFGAQAQWKWRDGNGRIQYSDLPPPASTAAKDILQSPISAPAPRVVSTEPAASASAVPGAPASAIDPVLAAKRKQAEQDELAKRKAQEAEQAQARAKNCESARAHVRNLESGLRMARTNAQGEREVLDDAMRAREMQQARQVIADECR